MKINKKIVQSILFNESTDGKIIKDEITSNGRWSINHRMIFLYKDKFYMTGYSVGATECQNESPFEFDPAEIECEEVHQVEKVVKVWEKV